MKLNCIVVDDSTIQRMIVTKLVNGHPNLNLVGEFSNAVDTRNCLAQKSADLIFLDIEMPVINGFDLLDGLKVKPQIIFITVKAEYALKAFDYDATDYLHKPISKDRFNAAVKRAIDLQILKKENTDEDGDHIFIKSNLKKLKIFTVRIKWIEAYGDYVKVVTDDENHLVLSTMKAFEGDLPKDKFIRVHKSFIVNIDKVEKFNSKYVEIGINKIPLSRNKKETLAKALHSD
ncbi:LytR/AlgR family response regulator transcription factor [Flavobacterium kingsejongi]|uniref:DNA-binding response regulator n=1 Tax=Flavobacterium kingsejongi TaxID=1678728 RepID=A0A2S1LS70_9FLAO|nr:LytTR family DNA-binding domain-containing protein [Flavobacterium kingsejongi]AWG26613.1 DNA-binding response regulator [Flavobacterium kingsejongi]